ncbi:AC4 [Bean calico mosaic virus]|uniref:AC4 n=1 Tax=Bean calico mosaic virus TaxID=31602 RepID=Q9WF53_9GEMI|nr:AC4 [Bean calico mosaic virus]AAD22943.1 AC4 [Bean calico mosaic virus]
MKLFACFKNCHGQSSNQHISESPERNIQMDSLIYTVSFNSQASPTSRMLDFSTLLTQEGLPIFTQTFRQPRTPTQSRTTSPKKVIIVNPGNIRCLAQQNQTRTTYTTTQ